MALRPATAADLDRVNAVIRRAVMTWSLPERVKRLAMPAYLYNDHDLTHLNILLAEDAAGRTIGVAAWEPASERDGPEGQRGLLLHGLYVDPDDQGQGVGRRLLEAAAEHARHQGYAGLLVKAQTDAVGYFEAQGLRQLAVRDPGRDYPNRYWLDATQLRPRAGTRAE